jgi:hypothetical protein
MENAPAKYNTYLPQEAEFNMLQVVSRNAAASGLYSGVGSEQKIFMILLAARELGIPPMQALNGGIWNIQGKIEISARLMSAMIRRAGHSMVVKQCDNTICIIEGTRVDNGDKFLSQFSMEDAARAGLAGRSSWKTYAEDMLYARAMSRLARRLFPDIIGTAYVQGEIQDEKSTRISFIEEEKKREDREEVEKMLQIMRLYEEKNPEEVECKMLQLLKLYEEEDHERIRAYIQKYASHWKKSLMEALDDYSDREKFSKDFNKWKEKELAKLA